MIVQKFSINEQEFVEKGGFLVERLFLKAMLEVERKAIKKPVRLSYKGAVENKLHFDLITLDHTFLVTDDLTFIEAKLDDSGKPIVPTVEEISKMPYASLGSKKNEKRN